MLAAHRGAKRVATILDQKKPVTIANGAHGRHVERIAQGVGDHDRPRARRDRLLDGGDVDIVGRNIRVDEDRNHVGLKNRIDRCREARGAGDHLVAWP